MAETQKHLRHSRMGYYVVEEVTMAETKQEVKQQVIVEIRKSSGGRPLRIDDAISMGYDAGYSAGVTSHALLVDALERAKTLLDATARYINNNPVKEYIVHYDEADCDGLCLAEDSESTIEEINWALQAAKQGK